MPKSCPVRARDTQFALPSTLLSPPSRQRGAEKNLLGSPLERRPRTVRSAKPLTFVVYLPLRAVTLSSRRYGDGAPSYGGSYGRRREKQRDGGGGGRHRGRTGGGTGGAASVSAPAASQRPCAAPLCLLARATGEGAAEPPAGSVRRALASGRATGDSFAEWPAVCVPLGTPGPWARSARARELMTRQRERRSAAGREWAGMRWGWRPSFLASSRL